MDFDDSQFIRTGDSTRAFFRGNHTFADVFGAERPQYVLNMLGAEQQIPPFPQAYSKVNPPCDSLISYGLKGAATTYEDPDFKVVSTVDANGNITELLAREVVGSTWENDTRETYTYNSAG